MPTYPTYKLGEICETTSGGTPNRKNDAYYGGIIPWVKSGELGKGVIYDTEEKITEKAVKESNAKVFPEGTLLIALYGATIGKLGFLGVPAATNQAVCGIFANEKIDLQFLSYYLFHKRNDLIAQGTGGAQPNISQTILKNLPIPLPPLPTQQAIVARIESLFAELDKAAEHLRTAQQQLKTYRQAVLNHWLNNDDGKWEMVKLKDCTKKIFAGGDVPKNNFSEIKTEKYRIPIYANAVKQKGLYGYTDVSRVNEPCVTIAGRGSGTGHTEIREEPFFPIVRLIVIIPSDNLNNSFLKYMVDSKTMAITGSAIPQLTVPTVEEYEFSLPPISDQHRIVQEIESRLSQSEAAETSIAEALQKTEALRQSILKKAFSGEFDL